MKMNERNESNVSFSSDSQTREVSLVPDHVSTGISNQSKNKWLLAHKESKLVRLTFSDCICFANLNGDGEYRLVIADLGDRVLTANRPEVKSQVPPRLLILKGTHVQSELSLPETPVGVINFRLKGSQEQTGEVLAVAGGSCVYVYKNLKPFYKFALPPAPIAEQELDCWKQLLDKSLSITQFKAKLEPLLSSIGRSSLSYASQAFVDLTNDLEKETFVREILNQNVDFNSLTSFLAKPNVITCFGRMRKSGGDLECDICLLLGTEFRQLLIVEPHAFTVLQCMALPAVPVYIRSSGAFDVDFRLLILCRDSQVYILRRGWTSVRLAVQLTAQPVAMVRLSSNILVACMNQVLSAHTAKAACLWSVRLPAAICAMISIHIQPLGVRLVAVALRSCNLLFFNERNLVDQMQTESPVVAMNFGHFGREEHTLVLITQTGDVLIHILKRTAKFFNLDPITAGCGVTSGSFASSSNTSNAFINPSLPNAAPLHIPKKTKLFVDQTVFERENSINIHRTFQEDLYFFRLITARAYVKALSSSLNPISVSTDTPIKLSAQVHGLGPTFRLLIEVQNTSLDNLLCNLTLILTADPRIYRIKSMSIPIAFLVPGLCATFATQIEMISELNLTDNVRVNVLRANCSQPIVSAIISMPASEPID